MNNYWTRGKVIWIRIIKHHLWYPSPGIMWVINYWAKQKFTRREIANEREIEYYRFIAEDSSAVQRVSKLNILCINTFCCSCNMINMVSVWTNNMVQSVIYVYVYSYVKNIDLDVLVGTTYCNILLTNSCLFLSSRVRICKNIQPR